MLLGNSAEKRSPFLIAAITTICAVAGLIISKYLLGSQPDLAETLVFAVIFCIIFFLVRRWFTKRLEKKK